MDEQWMDIYKSRHDPKSRESTAFDWDSIIAFHQADEYIWIRRYTIR